MANDFTVEAGRRSKFFDPTINLGHLLIVITLIGGIMTAWSSVQTRIGIIEQHNNDTRDDHDRLTRVETKVEAINVTLAAILQAITRLDTKVSESRK